MVPALALFAGMRIDVFKIIVEIGDIFVKRCIYREKATNPEDPKKQQPNIPKQLEMQTQKFEQIVNAANAHQQASIVSGEASRDQHIVERKPSLERPRKSLEQVRKSLEKQPKKSLENPDPLNQEVCVAL